MDFKTVGGGGFIERQLSVQARGADGRFRGKGVMFFIGSDGVVLESRVFSVFRRALPEGRAKGSVEVGDV